MSKHKINIVLIIMVVFIAVFFAGSFAYDEYVKRTSDRNYEQSLEDDLNNAQQQNSSGQTNNESRN